MFNEPTVNNAINIRLCNRHTVNTATVLKTMFSGLTVNNATNTRRPNGHTVNDAVHQTMLYKI